MILDAAAQVEADHLADQVLDRAERMVLALQAAGLDPFADAGLNLLVLQLLGPVLTKLAGGNEQMTVPHILALVEAIDLTPLRIALGLPPLPPLPSNPVS